MVIEGCREAMRISSLGVVRVSLAEVSVFANQLWVPPPPRGYLVRKVFILSSLATSCGCKIFIPEDLRAKY